MLVFLVGPTKASKAIATSNWTQGKRAQGKRAQVRTQVQTQVQTQADASACNWTQAAKQTQQDANAGASSKTDASEDAQDASSKMEARQAGAHWLEGTHLIVVKGKKPAKRTDKGGSWLQCWFF